MHRTTLPTRTHPLTGLPLAPVGYRRPRLGESGPQPIWPILGGDPTNDDPPGDGGGSDDPPGDGGGSDDPPGDGGGSDDGGNLGFPKDTALKDMTVEQREAYWQHQAKKHEKAWKSKSLVDMTPEQLRAVLDENEQLKRQSMSDAEKAIADARAEGERIGREAATSEARDRSLGYIDGHIDALLEARGIKRDDVADILDAFDRSKFLTPEGDVDTAKVANVIGNALPAGNGGGRNGNTGPDMGQGRRGGGGKTTGIDAGSDLYDRLHKK